MAEEEKPKDAEEEEEEEEDEAPPQLVKMVKNIVKKTIEEDKPVEKPKKWYESFWTDAE